MPKIIDNPESVILAHAKGILYSEGYTALSIRRIAKDCDIAIGTIYNYFPTKQALITQMMVDYWEDFFTELDAIDKEEEDFFIKLRQIYNRLSSFVKTFLEVWLNMNIRGNPHHTEDGRKKRKDSMDRLVIKMESILLREAASNTNNIKLPIDAFELSNFIIQNFVMMAHMSKFNYDSFEKIIKKLLL